MAELPISGEDAARDIKALILEKGISSLTSKVIRKHLEVKYHCSLSAHRSEIDRITMEKIGEVEKEKAVAPNKSSDSGSESDNESNDEGDDDEEAEEKPQLSSASKKRKRKTSDDESDFKTPVDGRRGATKKSSKAKSNGGGGKRKETGFSRLCKLSEELQVVVGRKYMRRHDVVKAMWAYFRAKELLNPKDRRQVICDEPLRIIFGTKKIMAFGMMGGLKEHISVADDLNEAEREKILDELNPERRTHESGSDDEEAPKAKRSKAAAKRGEAGPRRESGFTQLMTLSDDLAAVLGHKHMRRHQVVKSMWAYFKSHDLMDPKNRRMVILDEAIKPIFEGEKKIQAFGMMRYLKGHLQPASITDSAEREKILAELDAKFGESNGTAAEKTAAKPKSKAKKSQRSSSSESSVGSSESQDSDDEEEKPTNVKPTAATTVPKGCGDAKDTASLEDDEDDDDEDPSSSSGSDD